MSAPLRSSAARPLFALAVVVAAAAAGCGGPATEADPAPGSDEPSTPAATGPRLSAEESHARMVAALREIAERTDDTNYYVGKVFLDRVVARLERTPETDRRGRLQALRDVATAHLRRGNLDEALAHAEQAVALVREVASDHDDPELGTVLTDVLYELALVHFVRAERANCAARHTPESCLFPIGGAGVHVDPEPSRTSMRVLLEVLQRDPERMSARWLLNIAAMTVADWPDGVPAEFRLPPERITDDADVPRFRDVAAEVGLSSFDLAGGSIVEDLDGDGRLDVMTSCWDPREPLRIWRNRGDGRFEHLPIASTGLEGITGGQVIVPADFDNDGDVDVFVARGAWLGPEGKHPNSLLRNEGGFRFVDVTFAAGLADRADPCSAAAWADIDLDGDLDLFVGVEADPAVHTAFDQLFRNDGDGRFTDISRTSGIAHAGYTKSVAFGDYDGDRLPDLFVSNLIHENRLYRNLGNGRFADVTTRLRMAQPAQSFPAWFFDFDDDGALDLYVSGYASDWKYSGLERVAAWYFSGRAARTESRLWKGDGKGGFAEVSDPAGMRRPTLAMGSNFADVDGDGRLDVYLGTGDPAPDSVMPNVLLLNDGGHTFREGTYSAGLGHLQKGHGVSFADIDDDGDLDLFHQVGGAFPVDAFSNALFLNPGSGNRYVALKLDGTATNRSAIGTRIEIVVETGAVRRTLHRRVGTGGSFGANPLRQTIGLGRPDRIVALRIHWPVTGETEVFEDVAMDRLYRVVEGTGRLEPIERSPIEMPPR